MKPGLTVQMLRRDLSNLSLLRRRGFDGHIVSMHQSGTHWLKYLLAMVICETFDVPPPEHIGDNSVVGHPKSVPAHEGPVIVHSHSIPSPLVHASPFRQWLEFPPYVVLVRDIRMALVSHYEKWKRRYGIPFSEYLRGDVGGRRYDKDLWWDVRFVNAWSGVLHRMSGAALLVHYEDLEEKPALQVRRIWQFLGLPEPDSSVFQRAVTLSGKEQMATRENPDEELQVVRQTRRHPFEWYSDTDREFFEEVCNRYLHDNLGYDYVDWST